MRIRSFALFVVLAGTVAVPPGRVSDDALPRLKTPHKQAVQYVVPLALGLPDGVGLANGILVDGSTLLLTNAHVVRDANKGIAVVDGQVCLAEPLPSAIWKDDDLALVFVACPDPPHVALPSFGSARAFDGSVQLQSRRISGIDSLEHLTPTEVVTSGIITSTHEVDAFLELDSAADIDVATDEHPAVNVTFLAMACPPNEDQRGRSGSPVVDGDGEVVGVFSKFYRTSGLLVPIGKAKRHIAQWLHDHPGFYERGTP